MKAGRAYYAGGCRVLIDGTPCRVARLPSKAAQSWMAAEARQKYRDSNWQPASEARIQRAKQANRIIEGYAKALGLSIDAAKERIDAQRLRNLANPPIEHKQEYDL